MRKELIILAVLLVVSLADSTWSHQKIEPGTVSWKVDNEIITFKVEAETKGWVGIGWDPEDHGMKNADMVILTGTGDNLNIADYFSTTTKKPKKDRSQDITPLTMERQRGRVVMEFSRPLSTGDGYDKDITEGTMVLVWAYGDSTSDMDYHGGNRGHVNVVFVKESTEVPEEDLPDSDEEDTEPTESTESTESTEPTESSEPTEPTEPITEEDLSVPTQEIPPTSPTAPQWETENFKKGKIQWKIDGKNIIFRIEAKTEGWLGIGFNPDDGKMQNGDMVILTGKTENLRISDYYATGMSKPRLDDQQDVTSIDMGRESGVTFFEFSRPLSTGDVSGDKDIVPGQTLVIWAYGDSTTDIDYHNTNRGSVSIVLVKESEEQVKKVDDNNNWDGTHTFTGGKLNWKVTGDTITFKAEAETTGWFGIGWDPEDGKMLNADMAIVTGDGYDMTLEDYYSIGLSKPKRDRHQDLNPLNMTRKRGRVFMEFSRLLDTGDVNADKKIRKGAMTVIWAYGDNSQEIDYHGANRGHATLILVKAPSHGDWDGSQDFTGGKLSWRLEEDNSLTFRAEATTHGWLGIGWGPEDYKMLNADMAIVSGPSDAMTLADYYSTGTTKPNLDRQQDVVPLDMGREGGTTFMEFSRLRKTGDVIADKDILVGKTVVIWAYGPSTEDVDYHDSNRGHFEVELVSEDKLKNPDDPLYHLDPEDGYYYRDDKKYERVRGEYYLCNEDGYAKVGNFFYRHGKLYTVDDTGEYLETTKEGLVFKNNFWWLNDLSYVLDEGLYYEVNSDGYYSKDSYLWKDGKPFTYYKGAYYPCNDDGYSYHDGYYWYGTSRYGKKDGKYIPCNTDGYYFYQGYWWMGYDRYVLRSGRYFRA